MKKAVISSGSKQYLVSEGDVIEVELLNGADKSVSFNPLLLIDEATTLIGTPMLEDVKVVAEVVSIDTMADKVTSIRYKAKKRVHKIHGHRQHQATLRITQIK